MSYSSRLAAAKETINGPSTASGVNRQPAASAVDPCSALEYPGLRSEILDVLLPKPQLTRLGTAAAVNFPFRIYGHLHALKGCIKQSNFDFRGRCCSNLLLQIFACIKFRGRLPFWAVCESSASKPLYVTFSSNRHDPHLPPTTLDLTVQDQPCSNKELVVI